MFRVQTDSTGLGSQEWCKHDTLSVTPHILSVQPITVFHGGGYAIRSGTVQVGVMKRAVMTENHARDNTDVITQAYA